MVELIGARLGDVIKKTSFDQIYDEHVFLFSALSISHLANMHDLELIDVEHQITHGGSMRYTIAHKGSKDVSTNVYELVQREKAVSYTHLRAHETPEM